MAKTSDLQAGRRVKARVSKPNDRGWGIVVLIAAHVSMASNDILLFSGITYLPWMHEFDTNGKETAAVQSFMTFPRGIAVLFGGVLTNRFGSRFTGIFGGVLMWLGLFGSYWTDSIVQIYVTAAILGIGMGILMNAATVIITLYFSKRFSVANAITMAGRGTGSMAIPLLFQHLLGSYGWRGAFLVTSAIMAHMILCGMLFRHPPSGQELDTAKPATNIQEEPRQLPTSATDDDTDDEPERNGVESDDPETPTRVSVKSGDTSKYMPLSPQYSNRVMALLRRLSDEIGLTIMRKSFRISLICALHFVYISIAAAFTMFLVPRAETIGVAPSDAATLMSILGIGSLIGSLGNASMIGWRLSAEHVMAICAGVAGTMPFLATADGYVYLAVASFIYGFTSEAIYAIGIVLCRRFVGLQHFALGVGLIYVASSIGFLVGPVLAGWIFDATRSYVAVFYILGGVHLLCPIMCLLLPLLKHIEPGLDLQESDR